jgi:hypothetical protein
MDTNTIALGLLVLVMFIVATLYVMRRRTRLGRRKPTF